MHTCNKKFDLFPDKNVKPYLLFILNKILIIIIFLKIIIIIIHILKK